MRFQNPPKFSQGGVLVGDFAEHPYEVGAIEDSVDIRELRRVALRRADIGNPCLGRPALDLVEHLTLHVKHHEETVGSQRAGDWQSMCADPRANLEEAFSSARLKDELHLPRRLSDPRETQEPAEDVGERFGGTYGSSFARPATR